MFAEILSDEDASRATLAANKVLAHGFPVALTGGLVMQILGCY